MEISLCRIVRVGCASMTDDRQAAMQTKGVKRGKKGVGVRQFGGGRREELEEVKSWRSREDKLEGVPGISHIWRPRHSYRR